LQCAQRTLGREHPKVRKIVANMSDLLRALGRNSETDTAMRLARSAAAPKTDCADHAAEQIDTHAQNR
jgi:hypothetical protein